MNKKKLSSLLIGTFIIFSLLNIVRVQNVNAKPAAAVGLISFNATALDNAVRLNWVTGTESGTLGFTLKRSQAGGVSSYLLDPETGNQLFIRGEGSPTIGSTYEFTDSTAVNNNSYTYTLVEIESSGNEIEQDTVTITVGATPTATQVIVGGGNSTSQPTATPRPATATATAASSNATATAVPTNTIAPTVTTSQTQATATTQPDTTVTPVINSQSDSQATAVPESIKPTETAAVREITSDSNVAVAQGQDEAANSTTTDDIQENESAESAQTESYPAPNAIGENDTSNAPSNEPVAIGSENNAQQTADTSYPAPSAQTESQDSPGRAYLWVGFLVALLIFIVAVVGAIFLYTRKRNPGA